MPTVGSTAAKTRTPLSVSAGQTTNFTMTLAGTEYSVAFAVGVKYFQIANRKNGLLKLSFSSGASGTTYKSIWPGYPFESMPLDGGGLTVYLQSPKAGQILEIVTWS